MNTFLTIAASDPSGGAGIQADIKTACAHGVYAQSVITALTIQNTLGVSGIFEIPSNIVMSQCRAVFTDIFPDCVKIGMCVNTEIIDAIAVALTEFKPKNIVLDTILISSSGKRLISKKAAEQMKSTLFPLADIITPNIPEAEYFTGMTLKSESDMAAAAKLLHDEYGCAVMLKGGHLNGCDIFYDGTAHMYRHKLTENPNTHGTGCTLSSALACRLALGHAPSDAAEMAVSYVTGAIAAGLKLGNGTGPIDHLYNCSSDLNI